MTMRRRIIAIARTTAETIAFAIAVVVLHMRNVHSFLVMMFGRCFRPIDCNAIRMRALLKQCLIQFVNRYAEIFVIIFEI